MEIVNKVVIVTGGSSGIGKELCKRFEKEEAKGVVVADINYEEAEKVAEAIGGLAIQCDVSNEKEIQNLVKVTEEKYGPVDVFCSNAGIASGTDETTSNAMWQKCWEVNVMSHVYAARAVLPSMLERKQGYLLQTASAAGLLTQVGSAPYSLTKHAAVSFAEWLSVTYGDAGIVVGCLCPLGVQTPMIEGETSVAKFLQQDSISTEVVADAVVNAMHDENFLVLPHPVVSTFFERKAKDYDRWIHGMRKLSKELLGENENWASFFESKAPKM